MDSLEGIVLNGPSLEPTQGRVVVEDGRISAIEETTTASADIIVPAFVNAHTHIGDSVAKEAAVGLGLEDAVAPPNSRKHELLAAADQNELVGAMRRTLRFMEQTGTASTLDFREFGTDGAKALRTAAEPLAIEPFIFGSDEPAVLDVADGYGASGANDDDFEEERAVAREPALVLEPDLLVHMVHARQPHLDRVAADEVPIAVCPRANAVLDVGKPPIRDLLDHTTVALGTDNVMLNPPSMFREMAFTAKQFDVTDRDVLRMATAAGADIANLDCGVIEPGKRAALTVIDGDSDNLAGAVDPVSAVVRRATAADVDRVLV